MTYQDLIKSQNLTRNDKSDYFKYEGPFGVEGKIYFEDAKRYSDWHLQKIIFRFSNTIHSFQMVFQNIFFYQELRSEFHGPSNKNYSYEKTLEIQSNQFVLGVRLFLNQSLRMQGIQFLFNDSQ